MCSRYFKQILVCLLCVALLKGHTWSFSFLCRYLNAEKRETNKAWQKGLDLGAALKTPRSGSQATLALVYRRD